MLKNARWQTLLLSTAGFLTVALPVQSTYARDVDLERKVERLEKMVDNRQSMQVLNQLYALQDEVSMLRGQLDEAHHEIEMLKDQQRTLYKDLDSRLRAQQTTPAVEPSPVQERTSGMKPALEAPLAGASSSDRVIDATPAKPNAQAVSFESDKQAYAVAYGALTARNYQQSLELFDQMIVAFPQSNLVPNAYYWQGELYLLEKQSEKAIVAFNHVIEDYPKHHKYADALLKLGYAYNMQGDADKAQQIFRQVRSTYSGTSVARLAEVQLNKLQNVQL